MSENLDQACQELLGSVNHALGVAIVDLDTGLLLAVAHNVPYFTASFLDAAAAAAVDMFHGRTVSTVETLLSHQRGEENKHFLQEVQLTSEKTFHFMAIIPEKPNILMVVITSRQANLGMGWATIRNALPKFAPFCP